MKPKTGKTIKCVVCKKEFYVRLYRIKIGTVKCCSNKCRNKYQIGKIPWNKGKECPQFSGANNHFWNGGKIKRICKICKKIFYVKASMLKKSRGKYCSRRCYGIDKKEMMTGIRNYAFKGRIRRPDGYVMIYKPNHPFRSKQKYVFEHRLVKEGELGRYLKPTEEIHHINGNRSDNRKENLRLFSSKSKHMKFHSLPKSV